MATDLRSKLTIGSMTVSKSDVKKFKPFVERLEFAEFPPPWGEPVKVFEARMKSEGRWKEFIIQRAVYRARGLPNRFAHRMAQQHFRPCGVPVESMNTGFPFSQAVPHAAGYTDHEGLWRRLLSDLGYGDPKAASLASKNCSFTAAMDWVFDNCEFDKTTNEAPSKASWTLYRWVREDAANKAQFMKIYLERMFKPAGKQEEDEDITTGLSDEKENVGLEGQAPRRRSYAEVPKDVFRPEDVAESCLEVPEKVESLDYDELSADELVEGEDDDAVRVPSEPGVPGALAVGSDGPEGEPSVASDNDLARFG